ncbi:AAA family ATPase [Roseibium sp.]|uniref:AAA family ATPase n=1 Tax=Roseibium sp. TaxID=1936156 RepID=UPI0039EF85A9
MHRSRSFNSTSKADLSASLGLFLAVCAVAKAARQCYSLHRSGPSITGFILPRDADLKLYERAIERVAFKSSKTDIYGNRDTIIINVADNQKKRRQEQQFGEVIHDYERIVVMAGGPDAFPESFSLVADAVVEIGAIEARHAKAATRFCLNKEITEEQAEVIASKPLGMVSLVLRKGRNIGVAIETLAKQSLNPQKANSPGPMLQDLFGLGEAGEWGLELAADLADWRHSRISWNDVDRGILISGPAGTGKTTFAQALARTCNANLVLGSMARWQAMGHLGDMLQAMRKAFEEARKNVPAILFLDEIDAVGDRQKLSGDNADYSNQVVAALLECIDGAEGREGVVIVGACNHPEKLDAALVRAGRLDRHVCIPYPDTAAREGILRYHLQENLKNADLSEIAKRTSGRTGADLEQVIRDARRRARRKRRQLELSDVKKSLPAQIPIPAAILRRSAVHEAGHAIVGLYLGFELVSLSVSDFIDMEAGATQSAGGALFRIEALMERTRQQFMDRICLGLAGLAAEELVFGQRGAGGGGEPGSDLHRVTADAISVEATYGLGPELAYLSSQSEEELFAAQRYNPELRKRVNQTLDGEYQRASEILTTKREQLDPLAKLLLERSALSTDEVKSIVEDQLSLGLELATGEKNC